MHFHRIVWSPVKNTFYTTVKTDNTFFLITRMEIRGSINLEDKIYLHTCIYTVRLPGICFVSLIMFLWQMSDLKKIWISLLCTTRTFLYKCLYNTLISCLYSTTCVYADSRHGHVAAVYDYVSEIWTSRLIRQLQRVGSLQRLMKTSQTRHRWGGGVIRRRRPRRSPVEAHVADCLIGRGWRSGDGLSCLRKTRKGRTMMWFTLESPQRRLSS